VRDKHRAALVELLPTFSEQREIDSFKSNPGQLREPGVIHLEREERRHTRDNRMPERLRETIPLRAAPGCQQHPVEPLGAAAVRLDAEAVAVARDSFDPGVQSQVGTNGGCCVEQAADYRARGISDRKHPPVRFDFQFDAVRLEPRHRVARLKAGEWPAQFLVPARVVPDQFGRIETVVGDIAPPAAGDADLVERPVGRLENNHLRRMIGRRSGNRAEYPGGPAADYAETHRIMLIDSL